MELLKRYWWAINKEKINRQGMIYIYANYYTLFTIYMQNIEHMKEVD